MGSEMCIRDSNKRGLGSFISPGAEDSVKKMRIESILGEESRRFFQHLSLLEVTPDQLRDMYAGFLEHSPKTNH